ncbi:hypothetical protein ACFWY9_27740 [Amycolatopsis sp. NPDC059027]|uniref:hypothetical protein n=1 Tax=unclassified Amycolatopsis TaxID=2618356 RepID=UPI00366A7579
MSASLDPADEELVELFTAWQRDIVAVPIPSLVDPGRAAEIVARANRTRRVHAPPDDARTRPREQGKRLL